MMGVSPVSLNPDFYLQTSRKSAEGIDTDYQSYDLEYVLTLAKRFYGQGYKIYLDYRKSGVMLLLSSITRKLTTMTRL